MPLFPQGGGLYPDSIDNSILADMADGTVKGRPLGAGTGNPVDLTQAQLQAIIGSTGGVVGAFGACRLVWVSNSVIQLNRYNGCLLTIDNAPQIIPAAGVQLAPTGLTPSTVYYIYAAMVSGAMVLEASTTTHAVDARNGVEIKSGDATRTLVGIARASSGPIWSVTGATTANTRSWYNDPGVETKSFITANAGGSGVYPTFNNLLTSVIAMNLWANEIGFATIVGSNWFATSAVVIYTGISIDSAAPEEGVDVKQSSAVNIPQSISCFANFGPNRALAEGFHSWTAVGATSASGGGALWSGNTSAGAGRLTLSVTTQGRR